MGELILHIGISKTGTTALQQFLFDNREKLDAAGVHYPVFTRQPGPSFARNGIFLQRYARCMAQNTDPCLRVNNIEENLATLARALSDHDRVLITDEILARPVGTEPEGSFEYAPMWRTLARILEDAGASNVTIVAYLRRQDDWFSSRWRQEVKRNHATQPVSAFRDNRKIRCMMDYESLLTAAGNAFRVSPRIVVRPYDRAGFEGGSIFYDFCAAVGIPWDADYQIPQKDHNTSLSFDVTEALRRCSAHMPGTDYWLDHIIPLARELSRQNPDAPGTALLDEEAARALVEPFRAGNQRISDEFLGGRPLFSDEFGGRPVWVPNEERITKCQAILQEAIRQYAPKPTGKDVLLDLAHRLPEGVKRPLRAVRKRLTGK